MEDELSKQMVEAACSYSFYCRAFKLSTSGLSYTFRDSVRQHVHTDKSCLALSVSLPSFPWLNPSKHTVDFFYSLDVSPVHWGGIFSGTKDERYFYVFPQFFFDRVTPFNQGTHFEWSLCTFSYTVPAVFTLTAHMILRVSLGCHVHTDGEAGSKGVKPSQRPQHSHHCGNWIRNTDGGTFSSPNYPKTYPPNKECLYVLEGNQQHAPEPQILQKSWAPFFNFLTHGGFVIKLGSILLF